MRDIVRWVAAVTILSASVQGAQAGFVGMPRVLSNASQRISFKEAVLPPMAFTQFCARYADQCKSARTTFRPFRLTGERWDALKRINNAVNTSIAPERNAEGVAGEKWLIGPSSGDCNDYAVTKRFEFLKQGWPARSILLSEVVTASGEHHLVVIVRSSAGDLVLDNLTSAVRPWSQTSYRWLRMQTPTNPNNWASIAGRRA